MPRYDLRCTDCGHSFEALITFAEQREGMTIEGPCPYIDCDGYMKQVIGDAPIIWNTGGTTRGYGRSKGAPQLNPNRNIGHNPPTVAELGLSKADCREIGIDS